MADATIITGSLSDQEIKKSIDLLVKHVEEGTQKMAQGFDQAIQNMKKSLQSLGNISVDMGGASDGGTSRRTKRNLEEANSVNKITIAYDGLSTAIQKATQPKSAEQSFYAFIQNYRENAAKLANEIKAIPSMSLDRQYAEYQKFQNEIDATLKKISELKLQLQEVSKNPNASRWDVKAITDDIARQETRVKQLTAEQINSTQKIAAQDNAAMAQKQAQYEKTIQLVKELTITQNGETEAIKRQNDQADQFTRKIQRQAEIIRQRMQESGGNSATWGNAVIYREGYDPITKKNHASIEEQLTQAHREQMAITQQRLALEERERQVRQETTSAVQQQVVAEQQAAQTKPKTFVDYENFKASLAHVLGLQTQEIQLANTETASYNRLQGTLTQLQTAYNKLSAAERESDNGKTLIASMQEVQRSIQMIRQQASRPTNLRNVLGLDEKTLDNIAYKIQQLQSYRGGLNIGNQAQRKEIDDVNAAIDRLKTKQKELMGSNSQLTQSNNFVARSFDYIKNRLAFYFTIGVSTMFVRQLIEIRSQYELLERSIGILVDSMQQGSKIFSELNAMAIKSPFTTMELGAAAKQLVAYDVAAKDVVDTTKRLADMAAAVGVPLERLAYALGQIKAYGYLNARDARMFANAGIPLVKELADRYTEIEGRLVSIGDVYDRIKKKAISFEDVMEVVNKVTDEGGRFYNFQEKAADTLKVKYANLTLAYNNFLNELGRSNQSLINAPLSALKALLENWRKIDNVIWSVATTFGLLKVAQLTFLLLSGKVSTALAFQAVLGTKLTAVLTSLGASMVALATKPWTWAFAAAAAIAYLTYQYYDLQKANEELNKSISNAAQENINSIDKFFEDYKKQLSSIEGESVVEQTKMWERMQEEIEKSTKNANGYLEVLNNISDVSDRINAGSAILSQTQEIEKEVKRLADKGYFNLGGGFGNDNMAEDLINLDNKINSLIKTYQKLTEEERKALSFEDYLSRFTQYTSATKNAQKELQSFIKILDNADLSKVLGSGSPQEQLANLREFTNIIRDNYLATEKGQKIGVEGQAMLNEYLDEWISKQGIANGLLDNENAKIENNRTAWETFFNQLNRKDKERLDYLIKTNQTGGDEFKEIWDKAANSMKDSAVTSYNAIQKQIAELRNTPDIVINVVYRETKESVDEKVQQFKKDFLTPHVIDHTTADEYFKEVKEMTTKYARFAPKEGELNVEWEKRLNTEYNDEIENISKLDKQLSKLNERKKNGEKIDQAVIDTTKKERDASKAAVDAIKEISDARGFDLTKKGKTGGSQKDVLGEAFAKEVEIIQNIQKRFKEYRKMGVDAQDAIANATEEYGRTLIRVNSTLNKYGVRTKKSDELADMDLRSVKGYFSELLAQANALGNAKGVEALEKAIASLNVEISKVDYKRITDGLNNELGKIKDEYELAVELDANPELGDMFMDMFGIDTTSLPQTFAEAFDRANDVAKKKLKELKVDVDNFDLLSTNLQGDKNGMWMGIDVTSEPIQALVKQQKTYRDLFKKNLLDTEKMLDDYVKKYGDYSDKIAEIEADKYAKIKRLNDAYFTEQMRKTPEYLSKLNAIEESARKETSKVDFEDFKESRYYTMMFENLDFVSTSAIRNMRDKLRELMDSMKDLSPEQLKTIIKQYEKLEQKLAKRRPFRTLAKDLKEYIKTSAQRKAANDEFAQAQKEYDAQKKIVATIKSKLKAAQANGNTSQKTVSFLKEELSINDEILQQLKEKLDLAEKNADKYNLMKKLAESEALAFANMVASNLQSLSELRDFLKQDLGVELSVELDGFVDGMSKAGEGINGIVSNAQSGNVVGALVGVGKTVAGVFDGIASVFGGGAAKTKRINREIENSQEIVRQLSMAYKELERAVDSSLGAAELRARKEEIANKKAQLAELERQMQLEQSKRSKDRDDEQIKQYQEAIQDLSHEIEDLTNDITNYLLGDTVKDAAESFVETWVSAWRQGEDTMEAIGKNFDEMIDNMIAKSLATSLVQKRIQKIWDAVDKATDERSEGGVEITLNELKRLRDQIGDTSIAEGINRDLTNLYNMLGIVYGVDGNKEKSLSALQQGIQGITEETAGALESYMNGVSQQVYLQSDLLTQIRDAVVMIDADVQLATQAQMLLQLQQSYAVQLAIQGILASVLTPSGLAFRVELNS